MATPCLFGRQIKVLWGDFPLWAKGTLPIFYCKPNNELNLLVVGNRNVLMLWKGAGNYVILQIALKGTEMAGEGPGGSPRTPAGEADQRIGGIWPGSLICSSTHPYILGSHTLAFNPSTFEQLRMQLTEEMQAAGTGPHLNAQWDRNTEAFRKVLREAEGWRRMRTFMEKRWREDLTRPNTEKTGGEKPWQKFFFLPPSLSLSEKVHMHANTFCFS